MQKVRASIVALLMFLAGLVAVSGASPAAAHVSTCRPGEPYVYVAITTPFKSGSYVGATARVRCSDPQDHAPYLSGYVIMQRWNGSTYANVAYGPEQIDKGYVPKEISPFNYNARCYDGYYRAYVRYDYGGRNTYGKFSSATYINC